MADVLIKPRQIAGLEGDEHFGITLAKQQEALEQAKQDLAEANKKIDALKDVVKNLSDNAGMSWSLADW